MHESSSIVVKVDHLGKSYDHVPALSDVSFNINAGECFGLLGPNGAGKSTLIKLIYGVLSRSTGGLNVMGFDPQRQGRELRRHLGVVMQDDALDDSMTVRENMLMFCKFHQISKHEAAHRVDQLLEYMSLANKAQAKIMTLSGGMRRRLAFVRSLLSNPRLLILDEPTTGLDPAVRHVLWDKIRELKRLGTTTILTTHYMDEAELLCDRIVIIDQGVVKAEGSPKALIAHHCPGFVALSHKDHEGKSIVVRREYPSLEILSEQVKHLSTPPDVIRPSNLEDVFLKLTGRELSDYA